MAETERIVFNEELEQEIGSGDFKAFDAGDYEATIEKVDKRKTKDGLKEYVSLTFRIRKDVEANGKAKNRVLWDSLFVDKTNSKWFDLVKLLKIIKTQVVGKKPDGTPLYKKTDFANCDECLLYLNGLNMIITVDKEFDDRSNEDKNVVKYLSYRPSAVKATVAETKANVDFDSETDLPF